MPTGREVDKLPADSRQGVAGTLISSTDGQTLRAVFHVLVAMLNQEAAHWFAAPVGVDTPRLAPGVRPSAVQTRFRPAIELIVV